MQKYYTKIVFILVISMCSFTAFAQQDMKVYRDMLSEYSGAVGVTNDELNAAEISNAYTDQQTGITFIYLQQTYKGIKVYNSIISAAFKNGNFLYAAGKFVKKIASKAGAGSPVISHLTAVRAAAQYLQVNTTSDVKTVQDNFTSAKIFIVSPAGIARKNIEVQLYWMPLNDGNDVALSWNVNIDMRNSSDWWNIRIDAATGKFLAKDNWTVNENELGKDVHDQNSHTQIPSTIKAAQCAAPPAVNSVNYKVIPYPIESPNFGTATDVTNPWLMAGAGNNAITNGWHFDGNTNYNITRGNNVFAFLDVTDADVADATTNWPDTSTTAIPSLNFVHAPIFTQQPSNSTNQTNKKFAIDNLFYWNNVMHDMMYQYGLTETGGSFQNDNLGRGGLGNDYVEANAQDGGGRNNANFGTPPDGSTPRMQMYLWNGPGSFTVNTPASIAGMKTAREGGLTTTVPTRLKDVGSVTNTVVYYNDNAGGTVHSGCSPATNAAAISGHIALIDAFGGTGCTTYQYKIKNAQNAGAIAVIVYSNTANPINISGNDAVANSVTIPVMSITNADGLAIVNQLGLGNVVNVTMDPSIDVDGDIDNGIIAHEYGHGISNRLTGGPANASCLGNAEQGGEGWSDYFALMMTTNWATANTTDGPLARPMGTYVFNQPPTGAGIRRYPYSTNLAVNPLTYGNVATNTESHAVGEVWCAVLWDMTWNIIQQQGSITTNLYNSAGTGGNSIALNLVMTGMKLQPCSPGFIDARDAILAADSILYNNAHRCAIWSAFARRGMGASASQGSSQSATDQVTATNLPSKLVVAKLTPQQAPSSSNISVTHTATCDCLALSNYVIRDTIPAGFVYVTSTPAGTVSGNVLSFPATSFAAQEVKTFNVVLKVPATGCGIDTVINDNRETSTTGGFASSGSNSWAPGTFLSHSGTTSWRATDIATPSAAYLTSTATTAAAGKNLSILSFWHYYNTESSYDGGVVEYSTNGTSWTDASALFYPNTYNGALLGGTGLGTQKAFTGTNKGFTQSFINTSSFGTTPVQFRFRLETDNGTGADGWFVDDIQRVNGCGGFLKTGVYDGSNAIQDTTLTPIFVLQAVVALHELNFNASLKDGRSMLDWHTTGEHDLQNYAVEWSTDNLLWKQIGTLAAQNGSSNNYAFVHPSPATGNNFYRLTINESNGSHTYSAVRKLVVTEKNNTPFVLPNPAGETATLYLPKDAKANSIKIYNPTGALVQDLRQVTGEEQLFINTGSFPAGTYVVIVNGLHRSVVRMVVQH